MLRRLMVPLDGSTFAEQALPWAVAVVRRARAELHLVLVRAEVPLDTAQAAADDYLDRVIDQIGDALPGSITRHVLTNEAAELAYPPQTSNSVSDVLARHAAECDVELILMTTHARGGLGRAWLGSVADSLMRISPRPVLLVRPKDEAFSIAADADRGIHHILVPLDGSDRAERAIPFAQELGSLFDARYTLLRVVSPVTWDGTGEWYGAYPAAPLSPMNREAAAEYLETVAGRLRDTGASVATDVVDGTSPAGPITEYASTHAADLITLATAGAGGIQRLLLGSVADKVVRSATAPVLVCNPRTAEADDQPAEAGARQEKAAGSMAGA
jgi:nucleotide-binding universal stress UspA family protein